MQPLTGISDTLEKLREGFEYVWNSQPIRVILLMLALHGFVGMSHVALMPVFAAKILNGKRNNNGSPEHFSTDWLVVCLFVLSVRRGIVGLERLIVVV
ncbi:hypothetical protein [Nostoc sp.]